MFRSLTKSARGQYLRWSKDSEEGKTGRVPSFGRWRKWDSERWSALPKVTQLVKVRVQILVIWLQSKGSFLFLLLLGGGRCTSNDKIEIPLCLVLLSYLPCTVTAAAPNSSLDPWDLLHVSPPGCHQPYGSVTARFNGVKRLSRPHGLLLKTCWFSPSTRKVNGAVGCSPNFFEISSFILNFNMDF